MGQKLGVGDLEKAVKRGGVLCNMQIRYIGTKTIGNKHGHFGSPGSRLSVLLALFDLYCAYLDRLLSTTTLPRASTCHNGGIYPSPILRVLYQAKPKPAKCQSLTWLPNKQRNYMTYKSKIHIIQHTHPLRGVPGLNTPVYNVHGQKKTKGTERNGRPR